VSTGESCCAAPGQRLPCDYSWMPPDRRHIWAGLYLPGVTSEGAGEIAIPIDCSGSINARQLGLFEAEICSILEGQRPSLVHVLYFDTEVHKAEVYQAGQPIPLNPVGGGGTNFTPCFRWLDERGIVPQTLVFLTDLCGAFQVRLLPIPCCGPPRTRVGHRSGK
jgi:predicted metal-dependent peptidase